MPLHSVQAVFFDAVGTILHPVPSVSEAYWQVGKEFGSNLSLDEVKAKIKTAFANQEARFDRDCHRTCEKAEEARWRGVVAECLPDANNPEACFRRLHDYFAQPSNWRLADGLDEVLASLANLGLVLGVASNFDSRLREVSAGFSCLAEMDHWLISSEIGWRKPSPTFYEHLVEVVGLPAQSILLVGDDPINDLEAPKMAGMQGMLVKGPDCLHTLVNRLGKSPSAGTKVPAG